MKAIYFFENRVANTLSPMDYMMAAKQDTNKFIVIDVRNEPPHLRKFKIVGSLDISLDQLKARLTELPKNKIAVVYS